MLDFDTEGANAFPPPTAKHMMRLKSVQRRVIMSGYGGYGYGIGFRRLLIFLLVIATIFVFAGVGFGW